MASDRQAKWVRRLRRLWRSRTVSNFHDDGRKPRKTQYTPGYYRRLRKQVAGWVLVGLGVLVGTSHVVTHLGYFQVLPRAGMQDLLMGYPMAGVLVVAGIALLSP